MPSGKDDKDKQRSYKGYKAISFVILGAGLVDGVG